VQKTIEKCSRELSISTKDYILYNEYGTYPSALSLTIFLVPLPNAEVVDLQGSQ